MCAKRSGRAMLKATGAAWLNDVRTDYDDQWVKDAIENHARQEAVRQAEREVERAYWADRYRCDWCRLVVLREDAEGWDEHYEPPLSYEIVTLCPGCVEAFKVVEARRPADD